ncbi:MAG: DUF1588 domain-containing protein [Planctomycetes bacterium]|nr:DUF1588 domain-containing protein [Planctomycetota bacterium]
MPRLLTTALLLVTAGTAPAQHGPLPELVERHCAACHLGAAAEEGLDLNAVFAAPDAHRRAIDEALDRLRSATMPPDDAHPPTAPERAALLAIFTGLLPPDPEARVPTMRRLARAEYQRTVRDLTGVPIAANDVLPDDPRTYGFDNAGDAMTVSPLLFEKYADAAQAIAAAMLADPTLTARAFADDQPLATTLAPFLARAFRRPLEPGDLQERLDLHADLRAAGQPVATARAAVLRSIFASPWFLFRVERGQPDAPGRLTAHEVAVRLAYLLTGTLPDTALTSLADAGELTRPDVVSAQARRLGAETGGRALAERFAAQWLRLDDVLAANADFRRYPQIWNGRLRPSFREEAVRFFAGMVADDGPVTWLLDADHTWLDATLSKHYGFGDVQGHAFVRVPVPDRRRGGILGMGAMLMVSSYPLRTSPVLRGRWILDQLLDQPPPPPPANAGVLPADDQPTEGLSLRARLERHRRDPSCANCHARMDPLGFALENYDVLGVWRTELHGQPLDTAGELPDGTRLDGPIALKDALLARKELFVRALTRKLLVFAIGRPLTAGDEPEVLRIATGVAAADHRFSALLDGVVTSPLFLWRVPPR